MTTVTEKEGREMCEAICKVTDAGLVAIRDLGKAFGRIATLTITMGERNSMYYKERMKIK